MTFNCIFDLQMIKRKIYFILAALFLNFYCLSSFAQNSVVSRPAFERIRTNDNKQHYLKAPALIIPATFLIYGGLKPVIPDISKVDNRIMTHVQERYGGLQYNAADYLMWAPSATVYVMDAFKAKSTHNFKQHLILDAGSIVITGALGFGMRVISRNIKSFNTNNTDFPSGHTANAFRGAEILHQELKDKHPLLSYSGYVIATSVGVLRIYGKQHYFSEVLAGAGLGILSTKITYWIFDKIKDAKHSRDNVSL
jgi:membrane-associated phospholipid phosphatase